MHGLIPEGFHCFRFSQIAPLESLSFQNPVYLQLAFQIEWMFVGQDKIEIKFRQDIGASANPKADLQPRYYKPKISSL